LAVVKIGYDPKDGEIRFSVEAPIVAGKKAKECIQESIKAAIAGVEQYKQELRMIQEGEQSFREFYEKLQKSGEESSHEREIPEQERRRIIANIFRRLAEFIEGPAEETEKTEKAE
jgi:bacterioferritin (cytochrome b1)